MLDVAATPAEVTRIAREALKTAQTAGEQAEIAKKAAADLRAALTEQNRIGAIEPVQAGLGNDDRAVVRRYREAVPGKDGETRIRWVGREEALKTDDGTIERYKPGLLDEKPRSEWQAEIQYAVHQRSLARMVAGARAASRGSTVVRTPLADAAIADLFSVAPAEIKALPEVQRLFSDASTGGAEWIPDVTAPVLWETLKGARILGGLIPTVQASSKNVIYPFLTTGLRPYMKAASTSSTDDPAAYTKSSLVTANRTFEVKGMSVATQIDDDAAEDSVIDWSMVFDREVVAALRDGEEDAIVNGDTTATHQDTIASWNPRGRWGASGLGGTNDHRRICLGLRPRAFDVSNAAAVSGGAIVAASVAAGMATLDSPHAMGDLVMVISIEKYIDLLTASEVETLDQFGPQATILTGQLGRIYGIPVIVSDFMTKDLETSGLFTNGGGAKSGFILFNRARFARLERRGARVEQARDIVRGVVNIVSTVRETPLITFEPAASGKNVYFGYNI